MKKNHSIVTMLAAPLLLSFLAVSCSSKTPAVTPPSLEISNILVLPVDLSPVPETSENGTSKKSLSQGQQVLGETMREYLNGKDQVNFITSEKQETLLKDYNQDRLHQAMSVGEQLSADAVLVSQIERFSKRQGGDYSIESPASLSFKYRLIEAASGQTLCAGSYNASQEPWTANILSFKKTMSRGGKWITAKKLTTEAVTEKFNDCSYLNK